VNHTRLALSLWANEIAFLALIAIHRFRQPSGPAEEEACAQETIWHKM
jgi:hypothetical protein